MPNLRGAVYPFGADRFPEHSLKLLILLLSVAAVAGAALRWPLQRNLSAGAFDLGFGLALVVALLLSYHLQLHDLCLFSRPAALSLNDALRKGATARFASFVVLGLVIISFLSPLYLLLVREEKLHLLFCLLLLFGAPVTWHLSGSTSEGPAPALGLRS